MIVVIVYKKKGSN